MPVFAGNPNPGSAPVNPGPASPRSPGILPAPPGHDARGRFAFGPTPCRARYRWRKTYSLAATAKRLEREGSEPAGRSVRDATAATRRAIAELRALLVGIYPASVRKTGIAGALSDLVAPLTARDIAVELDVQPDLDLPPATEETLFRGAQEALRNVATHAAPHHVEVHVGVSDGRARLSVSDDGAGFSPEEQPGSGGPHFGLRLLDDLAAERGGRLEVRSAEGKGTRLTLEVPIE
jgi:signal transduction histidine kinase